MDALRTRGITLLAISVDTPDYSREFAHNYGLEFPLLSDADGAVSRIYAGETSDTRALPGVTMIRPDGRIAFRQVASAKDDRMSAAELIATADRTLGTSGTAFAADGYAADDRLQVRVDAGGGGARNESWRGTGVGVLSGLVPLGRHVLVGPRITFEPREAPASFDGLDMLRVPLLGAAGAIELGVTGGYTPWGATGADLGATADVWFASSPSFAYQFGITYVDHDPGGTPVHEVFATFGIARLIQFR